MTSAAILMSLPYISTVNAFVPSGRSTRWVGLARFAAPPTAPERSDATSTAANTLPNSDTTGDDRHSDREVIKQDIADMQQQATKRLDALLHQMEELQLLNERKHPVHVNTAISTQKDQHVEASKDHVDHKHQTDSLFHLGAKPPTQKREEESTSSSALENLPLAMEMTTASLDLLDDTVWKIVFSIGREAGTWMPKTWAASGDRLYFQCTVEFSSEALPPLSPGDDSFFQAPTGTAKLLKVTDAFIMPCPKARPSSDCFLGRRPLPVLPTGAYKVCRGQGPAGTDLLRFYIQLTEPIANYDDVTVPSGRIYGTCGYFASTPATPHSAEATTTDSMSHRPAMRLRDVKQQQHDKAMQEYIDKQLEAEADNRPLWDPGHWRKVQAAWQAKRKTEATAAQLQTARLRDPERSKLRFTADESVGLTAEGGVCCKVHHGLALEYHILGRLQVACLAQEPGSSGNEAVDESRK
jgi:hypothetical protein